MANSSCSGSSWCVCWGEKGNGDWDAPCHSFLALAGLEQTGKAWGCSSPTSPSEGFVGSRHRKFGNRHKTQAYSENTSCLSSIFSQDRWVDHGASFKQASRWCTDRDKYPKRQDFICNWSLKAHFRCRGSMICSLYCSRAIPFPPPPAPVPFWIVSKMAALIIWRAVIEKGSQST